MSEFNLDDLTAIGAIDALVYYLHHTNNDTILNDIYGRELVKGGAYHTEKLRKLKERGIVWLWWELDGHSRYNLRDAVERHAAKRVERMRLAAAARQHELNLNTEYCDTP